MSTHADGSRMRVNRKSSWGHTDSVPVLRPGARCSPGFLLYRLLPMGVVARDEGQEIWEGCFDIFQDERNAYW